MDLTEKNDNNALLTPGNCATFRTLETYWNELRHSGTIPFRSEVDPSKIDEALPYTFILQRVAPSMARVRVAGQKLTEVLGMDPRGMPISAFYTPNGRNILGTYLEQVFDQPSIVELPLLSPRSIGRPKLTGRMLIMPLNADDRSISMAMGAMFFEGTPGRAPRRFDIPSNGQIRTEHVDDMQSSVLKTKAFSPRMSVINGNGGALAHKKGPNAGPALRLVVNND